MPMLGLMGPRSRDLLSSLCDTDLSNDAFAFGQSREIEIGKEQARQEGKPEAMLERIAKGKLNKFYKEKTLLNQAYVKDSKMSVQEYLQQQKKDLTVTDFKHVTLG